MVTVLSYSEDLNLQLRLSALANELVGKLGGVSISVLIGSGVKPKAVELAKYFDKVVVVDSEALKVFDVINYAHALMGVVNVVKPDIVLVGDSRRGEAVASALSAMLDTGCVTGATKVELINGRVMVTTGAYGGLGEAVIELVTSPRIITIKPGSYTTPAPAKNGVVEELNPEVNEPKVELVGLRAKEATSLGEAEVIIVAGRGVKRREDLQMLKELAETLGGTLGCTQPLSVELNWFPTWIGISGVTVRPRLYIGVGVSGQVQHMAGVKDSKVIVAINNDPNAPIFQYTDYGVVGDLYKVLPELIKELKRIKEARLK